MVRLYIDATAHTVTDEKAFLKAHPNAKPLRVRTATKRKADLYRAIEESEGNCVIYKGVLRVIPNMPYETSKAKLYEPDQTLIFTTAKKEDKKND